MVQRSHRLLALAPQALLCASDRWYAHGVVLLQGQRVVEVFTRRDRFAKRATRSEVKLVELDGLLLTPGLVNAHAHLELSALHDRVPRGPDFGTWVRGVIGARAELDSEGWARSWCKGAERACATGTTLLGDIDSTGAASRAAPRAAPRVRVYREVLDAFDSRRTPAAIARLDEAWPSRRGVLTGFSPHAPHTTSDELLRAVARRARATRGWIGVHWAETPEEGEWLERDRGPFRALCGRSPRKSGLARLEAHGLLGPRTALYHGNRARPHELDRIARAGATLVHCPGTHHFFGRAPVDLTRWRARGVNVALGTDSLASNQDLDLMRELALLERTAPGLAPPDAWELVTRAGARALGAEGRAGEIRAGAWADFAVWRVASLEHGSTLEALTHGGARLVETWIGGARLGGALETTPGAVW